MPNVRIIFLFYLQSLMDSLHLRSMSTPQLIEMFYQDMCERQVKAHSLSIFLSFSEVNDLCFFVSSFVAVSPFVV